MGGYNKWCHGSRSIGYILPLLFSADQIFEKIVTDTVRSIMISTADLVRIIILFLFLLIASFCGIKYLNLGKLSDDEVKSIRKFNNLVGVTIFTIMSIVYVAFSLVQIFGLFLNKLQLPAYETFSSYARNGFFQLLNVALINLIMIVVSSTYLIKPKL